MRFLLLSSLIASTVLSCAPHATQVRRLPALATVAKEDARLPIASQVDALLRDEWQKAGVTPTTKADDATFARRAWIDIAGTIPPPDQLRKFLDDPTPNKRAKLVDELLASPAYADHWMTYWDDVLMGLENRGPLVDRKAFRTWLHERFEDGASWDRIARELIAATGQNGTGGPRLRGPGMQIAQMASPEEPDLAEGPVNGAVNWTLRFEQSPQDLGGNAARVFLGVQIQCAQCHDHKTEAWKQTDFRSFSSAFFRTRLDPLDRGKTMGAIRRVQLVDSPQAMPRFAKNAELAPIARAKPTALDGTDLDKGVGTRQALAAWMTSKDNPWFAKAFVNRMWGHFLGRGFYDPVDDVRPSNPATAPEILERLAADFAMDFDIKRLIRTICATDAYQLSASPTAAGAKDPENKLWGRFHLVPLGNEELLNAIFRATDVEVTATKAGLKYVDTIRANIIRQYAFLFDTDEDADVPDYSGTISQALALLNGILINQGSRALPGSAIDSLEGKDTGEKIDALALKVLSRKPTVEERARWIAYVEGAESRPPALTTPPFAKPPQQGRFDRLAKRRRAPTSPKLDALEDLLWTFLNSSEFTFNH